MISILVYLLTEKFYSDYQEDLKNSQLLPQQPTDFKQLVSELEYKKFFRLIEIEDIKYSLDKILFVQHSIKKTQNYAKAISFFDRSFKVCSQKLEIARNEADFLKTSNHPNIVSLVDSFQIDFYYVIVVEQCNKNLEQLVKEFTNTTTLISEDLYFSLAQQTLSAIDYLHKSGYQLENLSLKSILIDKNNNVKLYNFKKQNKGFFNKLSNQLNNIIANFKEVNSTDFIDDFSVFGKIFQDLACKTQFTEDKLPSTSKDKNKLYCLDFLKNIFSQFQKSHKKEDVLLLIDLFENCGKKKNLISIWEI
ncbi:hypothetical protein ABPG72_008243 [Tetrahymena utriculariae]